MSKTRFDLLDKLIERYNAGDAEGYAAFFAKDGVEAMYRGADLRVGQDGVRDGNAKTFSDFPQNRAIVLERQAFGDFVTLHERVWRTPEGDPFEVLSIYSFAKDDKISRVEFVR